MSINSIISAFDEGFERTKRDSLPLTKKEWQTLKSAVSAQTSAQHLLVEINFFGDYMATIVEQIFSEISHLCRNDDCAHLAAALVAKLVEEKFTSTNKPKSAICRWKYVEDGYWHSSCGEDWCFIEGTPQENRVVFCHKCGKRASIG